MVIKYRYPEVASASFICIFLYELKMWTVKSVSSDLFFFLLYASIICLLLLMRKKQWTKDVPVNALAVFYLLLFCNVSAIIRGGLSSTSYLDWKENLTGFYGGPSLLIPLAMMIGFNVDFSKKIFEWCFKIFTFSFLFIPLSLFVDAESFPRIISPVVIFILLIPYLREKHQRLIILIAVISAFIALGWRANVIKIFLSFAILSIYYLRSFITEKMVFGLCMVLFVVPLYFLVLGIQGNSIFEKSSEEELTISSNGEEENMSADTRTFLYKEVLKDLQTTGTMCFGKGATAKYKSDSFNEAVEQKDGRSNVEVGFLKMMMYTGIVGVSLYILLGAMAIYCGIFLSNNILTKMFAVFLATHWLMMFIENILSYGLYYYFSWVLIGLCLSKKFRCMSDTSIRLFFK